MSQTYIALSSGEPFRPPGAVPDQQTPDPRERIQVTVVVRSRCPEARAAAAARIIAKQLPCERKLLTAEEFERLYGARPNELALVESFGRQHGLRVVESSLVRCCVVLSGTLEAFGKAFQTGFAYYRDQQGVFRSHLQTIQVPTQIAHVVEAVFGLDDRPLLDRHAAAPATQPLRRTDPRDVARTYRFPPRANGRGQTVAIIELGGGFRHSDLNAYFARRKIAKPVIRVKTIDGVTNNPADPSLVARVLQVLGLLPKPPSPQPPITPEEATAAMWTVEATMDIQLIGTLANGADLAVYFAPGTSHGQYHAFTAALHSPEAPSVLSCSFGSCESDLPPVFLSQMNKVFRLAALKGVTICFSSGDRGDDAKNGRPRVHFPASSPFVLACGGTRLDPAKHSAAETVWDESDKPPMKSGGGVSHFFPMPGWQTSAGVKKKTGTAGRGVPDVAAKADLRRGYGIVVAQHYVPMGGTSAAAPLWAALIARLNQRLGTPVGYLTPLLYQRRLRASTRDIRRGSNGQFKAALGWDACTGWGSPQGSDLLAALQGKKTG